MKSYDQATAFLDSLNRLLLALGLAAVLGAAHWCFSFRIPSPVRWEIWWKVFAPWRRVTSLTRWTLAEVTKSLK